MLSSDHEVSVDLMTIQIDHPKTEFPWEPWKALAVAASAGAGLMAVLIVGLTLLIRAMGLVG